MKLKNNAGYSLVEVVVAIAILALIIVPVSTGMVTAFKMNAKAEQLMQAELAVSSAVEKLMANGIEDTTETYPNVDLVITPEGEGCYKVIASSAGIEVTTYIRAAEPTETTAPTGSTEEGGS